MMSITQQVINALLLGLGENLTMAFFVPRRPGRAARREALAWLASALLLAAAQLTSGWPGYAIYLHMLLSCLAAVTAVRLRTGWPWLAALQRGLSWYLVTESVTLLVSHVSRKLIDEDIFRDLPLWRMAVSIAALSGALSGLFLLLRRLYPRTVRADGSTACLCLLSALPYMFVRQITLWLPVRVEDVSFAIVITGQCSMLLSLILSLSLERLMEAEEEKRRALARQMEMERQHQQYVLKKNSIDAVRQQYHDMKNLLLYLEKAPSQANVHAHLGKILASIQPFESVLDTGNDAVDILLGEKLEVCRRLGIPCTAMVDGNALSFIDQLDLVTILGNAMDNAIEACREVEKARRSIQVRTAGAHGFVVLHIHNSCARRLAVHGALPGTTKSDTENHGYGLGNIRRTVEKYQGEMRCEAQNGEFELTLLFPEAAV